MTQQTWTAVDDYYEALYTPEDALLRQVQLASDEARLPQVSVSPMQGRFLTLMVQLHGARNILEIGTLGGYSTICMARALPAFGHMVTLEVDPKHARIATDSIALAGLEDMVDVRLGRAIDTLAELGAADGVPFDIVFIDADKPGNVAYLQWAMKLTRHGSLIIVDNVVRNASVLDESSDDASVQGVRAMNEALQDDPRLDITVMQTVGRKGYDGFLLARVV